MKKFLNNTIFEDHKYEVSIDEYNALVMEMQHQGFERYKILGQWERDNQTIYLVSFLKEVC